MSINTIIVGAGQLGSRHLQGLLKVAQQQTIYIIDPSVNSLEIAKERAMEVTHNHHLIFGESMDILPEKAFIAILATNANIRKKVAEEILNRCQIQHLILEKVLFQELEAYNEFEKINSNQLTQVWVNHPRRMFKHYQDIKAQLVEKSQISFNAFGADWGLACNALHFIDLFSFLSNSKLKSIDCSGLRNEIFQSKRAGFIEFSGNLHGQLENGNSFTISCSDQSPTPITVSILEAENRFIIQEGGSPQIIELSRENAYEQQTKSFEIQYQSSLTTEFTNDLINNNECDLPKYEDASITHYIFIDALLKFYNAMSNENRSILPIT